MSEKTSREQFKLKFDQFIGSIKQQITEGLLPVGEFLPSELTLAERYDLSKNSVRRGLELLVKEGLIVKKSRVGNLVAASRPFEPLTLKLGYYPSIKNEAVLNELIRRFEEQHPMIKVQTINLPYNHYGQTVYDFFQNDMVDAVTINYNDFQELGPYHEEMFEPLPVSDDIYPFLNKGFSTQDQYVKPFLFSPIILCYNVTHFEEHGIALPDSGWQWEDALAAAEKLSVLNPETKRCGFYFHPLSLNRWPIFLLQNQVNFTWDKNGEVQFDSGRFIESIKRFKHVVEQQKMAVNYLSDSDQDSEALFKAGKASMIMCSYFSLNQMKDAEIAYDIAPLPYSEDARTMLLMIGLAVNKNSQKKEAAKLLVDFLASEECQERIRQKTLSIPAVKKVAERTGGEQVHLPSRFKMFREIVPTYRLYSSLGLSFKELKEIRDELRLYLSGLLDEAFLCKRIEAKLSKTVHSVMAGERGNEH
ncbi:extracellular solute-binding protein [Fictibacillus sp. KIGAM418]|uniref:Extracellular solute-binding protein n=1 Tax=Fictibacillus marinisediminis TaxID=2878389 RepID=A0A9X2BH78_9BACL|nr:extracellular solute-binding protein [Fictibacillus marinisediminis]MCK6259092.1 extracellular solute-binding protein [Fictibacillus marinisediminis]